MRMKPVPTMVVIGGILLSAPAGGGNSTADPFTAEATQAPEADRRRGPSRQERTGAGAPDRWPPDLPPLDEVVPGLPADDDDDAIDRISPLLRTESGRLPPTWAPSPAEGERAAGGTYDCAREAGFEEPGRRIEVYRERWTSTRPDCGGAIERYWEWELWRPSDDTASLLSHGGPLEPQGPEAVGRDVSLLGHGPGLRRGRRRGSLGIQVGERDGVFVLGVVSPGPAAAAGMQAGDVITGYAGRPVRDAAHLQNLVSDTAPGTRVEIDVLRPRRRATLKVTIGSFDADPVHWR